MEEARKLRKENMNIELERIESCKLIDREEKNNRKVEKEKKIREDIQQSNSNLQRLLIEGFSLVDSVILRNEAEQTQIPIPNPRIITKSICNNILQTFLKVVPPVIWEHLAEMTNSRLQYKTLNHRITRSYVERIHSKALTGNDIIHAIGLRLLFSERSGIKSIKNQLKRKEEDIKTFPLDHRKYSGIFSSLDCKWNFLLKK